MEYLNIILWSLGIGVCLCNFYIYYNRIVLGKFVRELIKKSSYSENDAVFPDAVGLQNDLFLKNSLKSKTSVLYGVITRCENGFYIPEEKKDKAEKMYGLKGSSFAMVIISSAAIIATVYLLTIIMPYLVELAKNIF
ncbi:MAG: hypothetical protein IJO74_06910 [Clostridia bacterium]|nr:hypothetical protein [Clostridia bacterium]